MFKTTLKNKRGQKALCFLTAFLFFLSSIRSEMGWAQSVLAEDPSGPILSWLEVFPSDLGIVEEIRQGDAGGPFVIHIQDAHSNPSAQVKISGVLKALYEKFPQVNIGVEGAKGSLKPEIFDLFPHYPEANEAVVKDLWEKGEIAGSELFAWEAYRQHRTPSIFGIETPELYLQSDAAYRQLLSVRGEIDGNLQKVRGRLMWSLSRMQNAELREFIKERDRRKEGRFDKAAVQENSNLGAYIQYLVHQTEKKLAIDFSDPVEQLRFPHLVRLLELRKVEKELDLGAAAREWTSLLKRMRQVSRSDSDKALVQALDLFARRNGLFLSDPQSKSNFLQASKSDGAYPRKLLERIFVFAKSKKDLDLSGYPHFLNTFRWLVFQAEINAARLWEEMDRLENGVIEKLAANAEEKDLVRQFENFQLLEKLLHLELSETELQKVLRLGPAFQPLLQTDPEEKPGALENPFEKAKEFYRIAKQRDNALLENMLERGSANGRPEVLVIVSGGFHTEGIKDLLKERGLSYAVLTPKIERPDQSRLYYEVMGDQHVDLTTYFRQKNPFSNKREALLFQEMMDVAVPVLTKECKVQFSEIPSLLKSAVDRNFVLRHALHAQLMGSDRKPVSVRLIPKISLEAAMPSRSTHAPKVFLSSDYLTRTESPNTQTHVLFVAPNAEGLNVQVSEGVTEVRTERAEILAGVLTRDQIEQGIQVRSESRTSVKGVPEPTFSAKSVPPELTGFTFSREEKTEARLNVILRKIYGTDVTVEKVAVSIKAALEKNPTVLRQALESIDARIEGRHVEFLRDTADLKGLFLGIFRVTPGMEVGPFSNFQVGLIIFDVFASGQLAAQNLPARKVSRYYPNDARARRSETRQPDVFQKLFSDVSPTPEFRSGLQKLLEGSSLAAQTLLSAGALDHIYPASVSGRNALLSTLEIQGRSDASVRAGSAFERFGFAGLLSRQGDGALLLVSLDTEAPRVKDYRDAMLVLGFANKLGSPVRVKILAPVSRPEARQTQAAFDDAAKKLKVPAVFEIVGVEQEKSLAQRALPEARDGRFRNVKKALVGLPDLVAASQKSETVARLGDDLGNSGNARLQDKSLRLVVAVPIMRSGTRLLFDLTQPYISMGNWLNTHGMNASDVSQRFMLLARQLLSIAKSA